MLTHRCSIFKHGSSGEFTPHFPFDNTLGWNIIVKYFRNKQGWETILKYRSTQDARGAFLAVKKSHLGLDQSSRRGKEAERECG